MSSIDLDNSIFTMDKQTIQSKTEKSLKRKRSEPEISNSEENVQPALKVMITEEFFKHFEEFKTHTTTMYKQLSTDYVKLIQDERKKFEEERQAMKEERRIYQAGFNDKKIDNQWRVLFSNEWFSETNQRPVLMKLSLRKNNKIADKNRRNFLRIFRRFSRGQHIKRRRFSYRLSFSVVWEPQKFTFIQNKSSSV